MQKDSKDKNEKLVKSYIKSVTASLKEVYGGKVPTQFYAQLKQLADFYRAYLIASDEFSANPQIVTLINDGKTAATNSNLTAMLSISNHMDKLIKNFGLSPLALKRLTGTLQTEDESDFLDEL